jgi:hypothetical protein
MCQHLQRASVRITHQKKAKWMDDAAKFLLSPEISNKIIDFVLVWADF